MMRLFCWVAHRQYPASHQPETRVLRMRTEHRFFYVACLALDSLFVIVASVVLLTAATVALYKTIWLGTHS